MGMVIRTNVPALNSGRYLKKSQNKSNESLEKLASGFKINRAGDDASGLAISEKMKAQITALATYSDNAVNGISLCQTAEGYLNEVHDMLNRMVELSVKAANGIYEDNERACIQEEVNQLKDEIDRISDTANFNKVYLLKGAYTETQTSEPVIVGTLPDWATIVSDKSGILGSTYTDSNGDVHSAAFLDCSAFTGSASDINNAVDTGFHTTCCTCNNNYSIKFTNSSENTITKSGNHFIYSVGLNGARTAEDVYDRIIDATTDRGEAGNPNGHFTVFEKYTDPITGSLKLMAYDNRVNVLPDQPAGMGLFDAGIAYDPSEFDRDHLPVVMINTGFEKPGKIPISLPEISTYKLGVAGINVMSVEKANQSIDLAKKAINIVSLHRANIGSQQNRLEYTIDDLNTAHENISAANSRIRDTDMAAEMMRYTQNNILSQAAQSMLAQANAQPQNVLQLLQ